MKFKAIPTYRSDDGMVVQFFAVANMVGYSHRVIINGVATRSYLSDHVRPSAKAAAFFARKHQS